MTTADYDFERLIFIGKKVRDILLDKMKLVEHTGVFDLKLGSKLKDAGFTGAYHICRPNEEIDTDIDLGKRLETIETINNIGLDL